MTRRIKFRGVDSLWLQDRIASLWPQFDTVDIARKIVVQEHVVANWLADMRDRRDPRLRSALARPPPT